ncbi:MAG TPA: protein-L-isoaspartate O-methyltransferase [Deltaproteobacteria bacterium]|nr:MAG: protein-L-isoaspartate O-methyltransferase [Deltaproteobacteria bacterium GWA2_45_12]HBF12531.1 protein-L-isoaspartate O-methyltransferase [Deltaproteobacteria bacterium]
MEVLVDKKKECGRFAVAMRRMIAEQLQGRDITDRATLQAVAAVPRHLFVEEALADQAYKDYPIGIGEGQTISQPYMVAFMTQALKLKGGEKVLEIGTGCGYQTAVLAEICGHVYTIERIKTLALKARRVLKALGYKRITMRVGDGTQGWPEAKPFDCILTAAGSPEVPAPLVAQLKEGGRLVVPVGNEESQILVRVTIVHGEPQVENLGPCRFVKLVGRYGWKQQRQAGDRFTKRSLL